MPVLEICWKHFLFQFALNVVKVIKVPIKALQNAYIMSFFVAVPLHSSQTYSLQIYSLFMYKHSLQRKEVDLQAISVCCLIAFGLNGMLVNRKRETDLDFFVCCLFPMQGKTL